ncbi:hypothetical protein [Pantoea ananatis]|uniref:hypothetical protein n=1 Tax=Pantoea ananas TaxID=553 RepID=UPI003FA460C2
MDYDELYGKYTERASINEDYSDFPSIPNAWIYIAIDIRDMNMCKIGLTTKENPFKRISEGKTYNPFLELFTTYQLSACTWGCSQKELNDIEHYFHGRNTFGGAIKHSKTLRDSEWFFNDPEDAEWQIDWMLAKRGFSVRGWHLFEIYDREDRDQQRLNNINVDAMKEIKTIYRPQAEDYKNRALLAGFKEYQFASYIKFLSDFHSGDEIRKIYLK